MTMHNVDIKSTLVFTILATIIYGIDIIVEYRRKKRSKDKGE